MKKLLILLAGMALLTACGGPVKLEPKHPVGDYSALFYEPAYAGGFRIFSLPSDSTMLMLETYTPDTMRVVIPRGGFQRLVSMSSTYVAHLEEAGRLERLVGASSPDYISSEAVRAMNLPDVGYDGAMDYERLVSVKPEMVLLYGIGGPSPIEGKLRELDIPYVYMSDFQEQTPLGRAEWLVATGVLAGVDMRSRFTEIQSGYRPESDSVSVMMNAPYGGTWFIPGAEGYMSRLIYDAGGRIVAPQTPGTESSPIDSEQALMALASADVWLCPGASTNAAELRLAVPKSRFQGDVWNQTSRFYEDGAMRPDSVLGELKMIFKRMAPADSLRYFYRVK